jgi:hypothetical protein
MAQHPTIGCQREANMKIIKQRELIECTTYSRSFDYEDMPGAGFGFDCDEHGNVDVDKLNPCARKNYNACLSGSINVVDLGVRKFEHRYWGPAIGECVCGTHVELHGFTNTCDRCNRDYNSSGQLLAPRSQWGEETGESVSDILAIDSISTDQLFDD